jgi:polysaccharide biosynthesis transport protein
MTSISIEPTAANPVAEFSLSQLLAAVRRRIGPMAAAFGGVLLVALLAAVLWPPTFRSTGTILIEQQEVPTDVVRSAVTSYADQRVQVISQRVMTSSNLLGIIEKYKLYGEGRDTSTREALTERLRRDIKLQMISAEVMDPRQGRATKATIAFSVSYDNRSPVLAGRVANELTTLYLSENIESRKQLAASTADFLGEEAERLGRSVAALESKLADFKEKYGERLPEYQQFNLQTVENSRQELRDLDTRMRSLDQQIVFLDSQLAQIDPSGAVYTSTGERVMGPRDRLKVVRSQLASARSLYGSEHPDVLRYQREVSGLEAQLGDSTADTNDMARRLSAARGELASAQQRFTPEHPDVVRLTREVEALQQAIGSTSGGGATRARDEGADNPAYIQIRAQKNASMVERASLVQQLAIVRERIAAIEARQAAAPAVEQEYSILQRDLLSERAKYAEVRQKELEAQLVQNLETERKGERFTLIEPPMQPSQPVSPNRALVMLLGVVLAGGSAFALLYLLEQLDTTIRDRAHLVQLVGIAPLAIVPFVALVEDHFARRRLVRRIVIIGAAAFVVALLLVHLFVRPLDLVWLSLTRRLG